MFEIYGKKQSELAENANPKLKEKLTELEKLEYKFQRAKGKEIEEFKGKENLVKYGIGIINSTQKTFLEVQIGAIDVNGGYKEWKMNGDLGPGQQTAFFTYDCDRMTRYAIYLATATADANYGPFYPDDDDNFPCADVWELKP